MNKLKHITLNHGTVMGRIGRYNMLLDLEIWLLGHPEATVNDLRQYMYEERLKIKIPEDLDKVRR